MNFTNITVLIIAFFIIVSATFGYLYTNAGQQARDIKACQSVDANWRYSSVTNQVLCVPRPPQCKEYFRDE